MVNQVYAMQGPSVRTWLKLTFEMFGWGLARVIWLLSLSNPPVAEMYPSAKSTFG